MVCLQSEGKWVKSGDERERGAAGPLLTIVVLLNFNNLK